MDHAHHSHDSGADFQADEIVTQHNLPRFTGWAWHLLLLVAGIAVFLPAGMAGLNTFDEGFTNTGPMLIRDGKLPMRDFLTMYGPAHFYLNALLFSIFGEYVWVGRYLHIVTLAALGVTLFEMTRRIGAANWKPALWVWLAYVGLVQFVQPTVGYSAHLSGLFLLCAAMALGSRHDDAPLRGYGFASLLIGIAGLFRWDFGLFGLTTLFVCMLFTLRSLRLPGSGSFKLFLATTLPAVCLWAVVYGALLVVFGEPVRWFNEVVLFSAFEFKKWRGVEYVGPAVKTFTEAFLEWGVPVLFSRAFLSVAFVFIPPLAMLGAVVAILARGKGLQPSWRPDKVSIQVIFLALAAFLMFNQMRVRPTIWQGFTAASASLPLIVYVFQSLPVAGMGRVLGRGFFILIALVISAALFDHGTHVWRASADTSSLRELPLERARHIRIPVEQARYAHVVEFVRKNTREGEAIYSGVTDHTVLFVNDVMLYFLAGRPPSDRFMELEPGIANTRTGQAEIIDSLRTKNVRLIALLEVRSTERNLSSIPNGVTDLDDYIRANYYVAEQIGPYRLMLRNDTRAVPLEPANAS
jgi:hypothetical protein